MQPLHPPKLRSSAIGSVGGPLSVIVVDDDDVVVVVAVAAVVVAIVAVAVVAAVRGEEQAYVYRVAAALAAA